MIHWFTFDACFCFYILLLQHNTFSIKQRTAQNACKSTAIDLNVTGERGRGRGRGRERERERGREGERDRQRDKETERTKDVIHVHNYIIDTSYRIIMSSDLFCALCHEVQMLSIRLNKYNLCRSGTKQKP